MATSTAFLDTGGINLDPNQPSDVGVPPFLNPDTVWSSPTIVYGDGSGGGSGDTLSGIAQIIGSAAGVFQNVWRTVNPPQIGQINPQTGIPYGVNPTTGLPYTTTFGIGGGSSGILLLGVIIIGGALLLGRN